MDRRICVVYALSVKKKLVNLPDPLDAWLRRHAAVLGISMSELIRRLLDEARHRNTLEER